MRQQGSHEHFIRSTMRYFAKRRSIGPHEAESHRSFPADWFDLPAPVLADFGAVVYLTSLARFHRRRSLEEGFATIEPALRLGQYRIFTLTAFPAPL